MSASTVEYPCIHCGREYQLQDHWVYERIVVKDMATGLIRRETIVHPCVFQYEADNDYRPITKEDIEYARAARSAESLPQSRSQSYGKTGKSPLSSSRKKRNL